MSAAGTLTQAPQIQKLSVLGTRVASVTYDEAVAAILDKAEQPEPAHAYVCAVSVHGVAMARRDPQFREVLNGALMAVPDGMPLVWAHRLLGGRRLPGRVYGPTLTLKICEAAAERGVPIYLYGAGPGVADELSANLRAKFPRLNVVGTYSPPFGDRDANDPSLLKEIDVINKSGAKILFIGISTPRQDIFMHKNAHRIKPIMIGVGAAFDFHAGRLKQAPSWMQNCGLEWFFRLCMEPRRLWKRYLVNVPYFIARLTLQCVGLDAPSKEQHSS